MLDWIRNDMKEDPEKIIDRLSLLMRGNFARALDAYRNDGPAAFSHNASERPD